MPADPVFMRVSGKPQSGNFSNLGWQFLEPKVAVSRTLGGNFSNLWRIQTIIAKNRMGNFWWSCGQNSLL